jgi:hypothetical protein
MDGVIRLGDRLSAGGCVTEASGEMFDEAGNADRGQSAVQSAW